MVCFGGDRGIIRRLVAWRIAPGRLAIAMAICTIALGAFYIASCPVGHIPDVWEHVYRISGIVNGDIVARPVDGKSALHSSDENVGGAVDGNWIILSNEFDDGYDPGVMVVDPAEVQQADLIDAPYNNSAINSPIAYLPQILVFVLGNALGLSALATYYLAEWGMLFVYAACMAGCVAVIPRFQKLAFLTLLMPSLTFRYSFAISADSFTLAIAILFTGLLFSCALGAEGPPFGRVGLLAGCGILLALTKMTYLPLVFLMLLLLVIRRRLGKAEKIVICAGALISLVLSLAWLSTTHDYVTTPSVVSSAAVAERVASLKADPLLFLGDYLHAIVGFQANNRGNSLMLGLFWLFFLIVFVALIAVTVAYARKRTQGLGKGGLLFLWICFAACTVVITLVYLALWMQYTPTSQEGVMGLQFRYANPIFFMLALVLFWSAGDMLKGRREACNKMCSNGTSG